MRKEGLRLALTVTDEERVDEFRILLCDDLIVSFLLDDLPILYDFPVLVR